MEVVTESAHRLGRPVAALKKDAEGVQKVDRNINPQKKFCKIKGCIEAVLEGMSYCKIHENSPAGKPSSKCKIENCSKTARDGYELCRKHRHVASVRTRCIITKCTNNTTGVTDYCKGHSLYQVPYRIPST
uniref:Uncharacterized protein n=1 Tax=Aplanochytrium stocchinoi TaxID=215587 RepID=A0A7S3PDT8_9STRA|mmetsp:Transcript_9006/g.11297  ORF Transcript_9006/g.11297 Transcript_9006/m.11297 type:complete len:131 (+) Transcript_9006:259-651(+)